jgi:hypothetical protein
MGQRIKYTLKTLQKGEKEKRGSRGEKDQE